LSVPVYTCGAGDANAVGILYENLRSSLNLKGMCNLAARVVTRLVAVVVMGQSLRKKMALRNLKYFDIICFSITILHICVQTYIQLHQISSI